MTKPRLPRRVRNHVNPLADQSVIDFGGFSSDNPIIVDIGAYRGEFTQSLVGHHGEAYNYIVTEIRKPYEEYLRELFASHDNIAVFGGDSARNISGLVQHSIERGVTIAYIFINFPDPWFKEKHKKRRVLNPHFLDSLAQLITGDTTIVFQTDQKQLFEETVEVVQEDGRWDFEYFTEPLWGIQSYWEQIKIGEGDTIYRMQITLRD